MNFLAASTAKEEGYVPAKNNIVGLPGLGIFTSKNGSTALCSEVDEGNLGVLNIYNVAEGTKISCGHILDDGTCGYRLGKNGEIARCPLVDINSISMINPNQKQAA